MEMTRVSLVDFWASWCGPCRREMPNLVETYAKYKGKNFEIVGVSLDQDGAAWKEAIKKMNMTWPQMSDLKFWQSEGAQLYAVNSIPPPRKSALPKYTHAGRIGPSSSGAYLLDRQMTM